MEKKKAILVISFGTTYEETRENTIGAVEEEIRQQFPEYEVRRAFTSDVIRDILQKQKIEILSIKEALQKLLEEGIEEVLLQPTHLIAGEEYEKIKRAAGEWSSKFKKVQVGRVLLHNEEDQDAICEHLLSIFKPDQETELVLMGHGTSHENNQIYTTLAEKLWHKSEGHILLATVEARPNVMDIMAKIWHTNAKKVVLAPLMLVAGDHAHNDMAGEGTGSWRHLFEKAGYAVTCSLKGLGEYAEIRRMYIEHIRKVLKKG